jgi:hypothetical protein
MEMARKSMLKKIMFISLLMILTSSFAEAQTPGLSLGMGHSSIFRVGPGKDSTGTTIYSFTYVYGAVVFDARGKIVDLEMDELEVSTPNYPGKSMPHFSGWPGSPEPNLAEHGTNKIIGKSPTTVDAIAKEVTSWTTKRDRADEYGMNTKNDWWKQMDAWEKILIGKTIEEIDVWFAKYTNPVTARPLNPQTQDAEEKAKFDKLSDADKKIVVDTRTGATMSINDDGHGYVIAAIKDAFNKKKPMRMGK